MNTVYDSQHIADALATMVGPSDEERASLASTNPQSPAYWLEQLFGAPKNAAGVTVTEKTALTFSAVLGCVRILSESVAMLPAFVYRRLPGGGKERVPEHPVYRLIHDDPNDEQIPFGFKETLMGHVVTWGNGYAEIERSGAGIPLAMHPLTPCRVRPVRLESGRLVYDVRNERGPNTVIDSADMLHIPGLSYDGLVGYSPIRMAMQAIGLGMAAETFGAKFFSNGANVGGILEHPGELGAEGIKNVKQSFQEHYQGLDNSHIPLVLEEGMKFQKWSIPPNEAQFLETRKFQVEEIARIYRVPPHMLADLERATFSNIEQQSIDFIQHTLMPWLVRWEQWFGKKLLTRDERAGGLFVEFQVNGLLRGDATARGAYYRTMREVGAFSANDIRELENMNPLPDDQGNIYVIPANMVNAANVGKEPKVEPKEKPAAEPADDGKAEEKPADAVRDAMRIVARDAASRIVRKETLALGRAAGKQNKIEEFFAGHAEYVTEVISPVADSMRSLGFDADAKAIAGRHVDRAKAKAAAGYEGWGEGDTELLVRDLIGDTHE